MLKIGSYTFELPVVQAALSGYSDIPMRLLARRFGAPYCIHEVVLDQFVTRPGKFQKKTLEVPPEDHPVGGQLMGSEPAQFAEAAAIMAEAAYDVIDINFGCPVKKVLGRCRGGYLLSDPTTAIEILTRVRDAVPGPVPVTLKMRRGMDDSAKSERNFFTIFDKAFELGLAAITVHGRTVVQKYVGRSNWDFLTRVKKHAGDKVVLGSGDLFTAHDVKRMLDQTGIDGVTLARGCIGNPWIFRDCAALLSGQELPDPPSVPQQAEVMRLHYQMLKMHYGESAAPKLLKRFAIRYTELHPHTKDVRNAFAHARTDEDWQTLFAEWYDPDRDWPPTRRKPNPSDLIAAGAVLDSCSSSDTCG
jgi:tRNA-dihydrouridine synthase B